jgi:hypothetical protein
MVVLQSTQNFEVIKYSNGSIIKRVYGQDGMPVDVICMRKGHKGKVHIESPEVHLTTVKGD